MLEDFYLHEFEAMSQYNEADWVPNCTTALGQISYCVDDTYLTPQLTSADTASFPATPATNRPRSSAGFYNQDVEGIGRRRSQSAGYYTPHLDDLTYHQAGLGIKHESPQTLSFAPLDFAKGPAGSAAPPNHFFGSLPVPDMSYAAPRLAPVPIAPNPAGGQKLGSLKRGREDETSADVAAKRTRRSSVNTNNLELTEEERLLLQLKDEMNLPWKDIALRFQVELGKNHQVPALQMRYKRLRERLRVWTEVDVQALQQARDYWEKFKWDIIALKMLDFGCSEKWPAKYCIRKWEELHPDADMSKERAGSDHGTPELLTPRG
ncbi:MAG: hypothetical protein M1838_000171 [Thelocarpon superellum]|nr:MAG: hypothetical protein M1838_000171 [Thelocarpon superellum]